MSSSEMHERIVEIYDQLDYEHHGRMHRAGLVYLVALYLNLPEDEVFVTVDLRYGWAEDIAASNDMRDNNDRASSTGVNGPPAV